MASENGKSDPLLGEKWQHLGPVARIPWLPVKFSKVRPEEKKFFQKMMSAGEEGSCRLIYYRILTKTFPFYLPKR